MCGFFALAYGISAREFADMFGLSQMPKSDDDLKSFKFAPTSLIATISKNSPNQLKMRYWSLVPRWWKDDPYHVPFSTFNARSEDIDKKATYRTPWKQGQRCLIPVSWFYEFQPVEVEGEKRPRKMPFRVDTSEEIFTLAGLYETWQKDEKIVESVTIITCESVPPLRNIHNRQPVIIKKEDREKWLDKTTSLEEAYKMLVPTEDLEVSPINYDFNKARGRNINEQLVTPLLKFKKTK